MKCYICESGDVGILYKLRGHDVVRCENCGLRFSWPPKKHDYEEDYFTQEQKDYFNKKQDDSKIKLFKYWLKEIERFVKSEKGKRKVKKKILDVGCATGVFLNICKKHGWDCYGIDISKYASDYARKKFGVKTKAGELTKANYKDNFFNIIFMSFIIEHTSNPDEIIKEAKRILKKDGVLFVSTINEDSLLNLAADFIYKASFGAIKKPIELLHAEQHLTHFSEKDLIRLLKKNGFRILNKQKFDLPPENFGGGFLKDIILNGFYFFQKIFGKEYLVWVFGGKINLKD